MVSTGVAVDIWRVVSVASQPGRRSGKRTGLTVPSEACQQFRRAVTLAGEQTIRLLDDVLPGRHISGSG